MSSTPGRNDPCPCGSPKKYKHCCLVTDGAADSARVKIRSLEGRVVEAVFKYALQRWGEPLFHHAWEDFWGYDDVPEDIVGTPEFDPMFVPWFTTLFLADPAADRRTDDWPARTLAQEWLHDQPGPPDPDVRDYVTQAARSPLSAFVVEQVVSGVSLDVKDIFTGRQFHVLEVSGSRSLEVGAVIFTRVVTLHGVSVMFGMAPYAGRPDWQLHLIDWRQVAFKRRLATRADLDDFDGEIRDLYFEMREAQLNPRPPILKNSDGDLLSLVTLTYDLHVHVHQVYPLLLPLATLGDETHVHETEENADGAIVKADFNWVKAGNRQHRPWTNTILGRLALSAGRLVAETNSEKRAKKLEREIAQRLGRLATLVDRRVTDPVAQMVETQEKTRARKGMHLVPPPPPSASDPDLAALETAWRRQHAEEWLDTKVPALRGKTPRQAARSAAGRERLEALLHGFLRHPGGSEDVAFLRAALKLTD